MFYYVLTHLSDPWVSGPLMMGGCIVALLAVYLVAG